MPYGFDRESYVKVLDHLEDEGDIVSYDDLCDKQGFKFEVKLKQNISAKWTRSKIISKFKLSKPFAQNLTVIDYEGKLREYDDARQLIKDFCDYRLGILKQRIDARKAEYEEEVRWLNVKMEFVQANVDGRIVFKDNTKTQVIKQIMEETSGTGGDTNRLLALSILNLTKEEIVKLKKQIAEYKVTESESRARRLAKDLSDERKRLKQELAELQQENEELTPTTPTGTLDWYVKWVATMLAVSGVFLISAGYSQEGNLSYLLSTICWVYVGMVWSDRAIMIGSSISGTAVAMNLVTGITGV